MTITPEQHHKAMETWFDAGLQEGWRKGFHHGIPVGVVIGLIAVAIGMFLI